MRNQIVILVFSLLLITACVFLPSLNNGFTNWDDQEYVINNAAIRDFSFHGVGKLFTSFHLGLYKPLVFLTYLFEYHFFKLDPFIYHATNLVFHLLNCALVFFLIFFCSKNAGVAFITAILFSVHPLRVESVAWISERKDVIYSLFFLVSLICYFYYHDKHLRKYYYLSMFCFILSLIAKPAGITLPFLLFFLGLFYEKRISKKNFLDVLPFFVISFIILAAVTYSQSSFSLPEDQQKPTFLNNILIASHAIIFYLQKIAAPVKLSCFYPYPKSPIAEMPKVFIFSPLAVVFLIAAIAFMNKYAKDYGRKIVLGSIFFLITIFPVLQLIPIGPFIAADRYTYIPSIGIFYIFGEILWGEYKKRFSYNRSLKIISLVIFFTMVMALSFLTNNRIKVWKNGITLWSDVLTNYPHAPLALYSRALAYADKGNFDQAISDFTEALKLKPEYWLAFHGRGAVYAVKGNFDQAISDFTQAIKFKPKYALAFYVRALAYAEKGKLNQAISDFTKALELDPSFAAAYYHRGKAYAAQGDFKQSILDFNSSWALYSRSLTKDSIRDEGIDRIAITGGAYAEAYDLLAVKFVQIGKINEAASILEYAIKVGPSNLRAYVNLAAAYGQLQRYKEAITVGKKLIELDPAFAQGHYNLSVAYYFDQQYDLSSKHLEIAIKLGLKPDPEFAAQLKNASSGFTQERMR